MLPARAFSILAVVMIFAAVGCESKNKGKIEATRWTSIASTVKGVNVPADTLQLSFGGDGRMIYRIKDPSGYEKTIKGRYSLGFGDSVILDFDETLAGMKTHNQTVKVQNDRLTMIDSDGTSMTFVKK